MLCWIMEIKESIFALFIWFFKYLILIFRTNTDNLSSMSHYVTNFTVERSTKSTPATANVSSSTTAAETPDKKDRIFKSTAVWKSNEVNLAFTNFPFWMWCSYRSHLSKFLKLTQIHTFKRKNSGNSKIICARRIFTLWLILKYCEKTSIIWCLTLNENLKQLKNIRNSKIHILWEKCVLKLMLCSVSLALKFLTLFSKETIQLNKSLIFCLHWNYSHIKIPVQ